MKQYLQNLFQSKIPLTVILALLVFQPIMAQNIIYQNDFEAGSISGLTIVGDGEFESSGDATRGQVFHNNPAVTGDIRTHYLELPSSIFSDFQATGSDGLTISFWVNDNGVKVDNPAGPNYYNSALFGAYGAAPNPDNDKPVFALMTRATGLINFDYVNTQDDTNYGWVEFFGGATVNWVEGDGWHHYAFTITPTEGKVYADGNVINTFTFDNNVNGLFNVASELSYITLGGNQAWGWGDPDTPFSYDDITIFDAALTHGQVISLKQTGDINSVALNASKSVLYLDNILAVDSLVVDGINLTEDITITAPTAITVDPTTIAKDAASGAKLTVTFDGSATIDDVITLTSGSTSVDVMIKAYDVSDCYTATYGEGNIVPDPTFARPELIGFGGWGSKGVTNDPEFSYCGPHSGFVGNGEGACSGSLDVVLSNKITAGTAYRIKARTLVPSGQAHIGFWNMDITPSEFNTTLENEWEQMDFVIKPGANVDLGNVGMYLNSCGVDAPIAYIDNWEFYEVPATEAGIYNISLNVGGLDVKFDPATLTYTATVPYGTASVTPTVLTVDPDATYVGGDAVDISADGTGTSTIVVTARDGSTTGETYTVTYAWNTDATLGELSTYDGNLIPAFNPTVYEYTLYANYGVSTVEFTATAAESSMNVTGSTSIDISDGAVTTATFEASGTNLTSFTYTVTIIPVSLKHAYTFDTDASDSEGSVDGVLNGAATIENGMLILAAEGDYVSFDGTSLDLTNYDAITLENYVVEGETNAYNTMFNYFGTNENTNAFWTSFKSGGILRAFSNGTTVDGPEVASGLYHHMVAILKSDSIMLYYDGDLVAASARTGDFNIGPELAYLGKGGWPDPTWLGSVLEFNIYNGVMDATSIAQRSLQFDTDNDGYPNDIDNCPDTYNPSQADHDDNGVGNVCDPDFKGLALLSDLIPNVGTIAPDFEAEVYDYMVFAPYGVTSVTLDAPVATSTSGATFTVTGNLTVEIDAVTGIGSTSLLVESDGDEASSTYNVTVIGVNLTHSYDFETDLSDGTGSANGSAIGTAEVVNGVLVLDAAGDYIEFNGSELGLDAYNALSLEFYLTAIPANDGWAHLFYFGDDAGTNALRGSTEVFNNGKFYLNYSGAVLEPENTVDDGNLHHVVITLSSDLLKVYQDGVMLGELAVDGYNIGAGNARVGKNWWDDPTWQGTIHEFNIYNGVMDAEGIASRVNRMDIDQDGILNSEDDDDDGDGMLDEYELAACADSDPLDPNSIATDVSDAGDLDEDGITDEPNGVPDCLEVDSDDDGIQDYEDNCPTLANADQSDIDEDGIGDLCDDDDDNDGILDVDDNCPETYNPDQADDDGDDIGDVCDDYNATNSLDGNLAFGEIGVGESKTLNLSVFNEGTDDLDVTAINTPDGFSVDQSVFTVTGKSLKIVKVTFAPTQSGDYNDEIEVVSTAGTATIAVSGSATPLGLDPVSLGIKLGPNPVSESIMINWSKSDFRNPTIRVINLDGKLIWEGRNLREEETTINLGNMAKGLFLIQMQNEDTIHTFKMLKN
jgi:hypothetical protein